MNELFLYFNRGNSSNVTEITELFVFASFGKVHFLKFGNFLEITGFFKLAKISRKKFGNNFLFLGQKTLFLGQKVWKKFGKVWKQGFPNILNFWKFWKLFYYTFQKVQKNDVKLELQKWQKTCSNSKVQLKVWNAEPYF